MLASCLYSSGIALVNDSGVVGFKDGSKDAVSSIVFSHWYYDWGDDLVKKKDGTPYSVAKGAFRNHPCTQWAAVYTIQHG